MQHRSAHKLVTCRWCKRERPLTVAHCAACGPPIVVRMIHDGVYAGLVGVPVALAAFVVVWLGGWITADVQMGLYALPAAAAVVGVVVGFVASIAWRIRGWHQARQRAAVAAPRE